MNANVRAPLPPSSHHTNTTCVSAPTNLNRLVHVGTQKKREEALKDIREALVRPPAKGPQAEATFEEDMAFASSAMAKAVKEGSWSRNRAWIRKFQEYVGRNRAACGLQGSYTAALLSDRIALGFLASVLKEQPRAKTRVKAAKRAVNLLRALADAPPLEDNVLVRLLSRAAKNNTVSTTKKSAPLLLDFVRSITANWGEAPEWWKRQITLMVLLAMCVVARGGGICECLRDGVTWVRADGTMVHDTRFIPAEICHDLQCRKAECIRGLLLLLPFRKNKVATPSWMPVVERNTLRILCRHLRWLRRHSAASKFLFVPRIKRGYRHNQVFVPSPFVRNPMHVDTLRLLLRQALVECCGLTAQQAAMFGTHSIKNGATEALRASGVDSETRRQLGDWMSPEVALSYLQLTPGAQFSLLQSIGA